MNATRRIARGRLVALAAVALALAPAPGASAPQPNVLLLVAEDMSPRVAAFGDEIAVTPHLDRLAAEGVRYPNSFATAGVCAPSRAALLTGVHQIALGAAHQRTADRDYRAVPPPAVKAFPELLRRAGYWTYTGWKLDYQFSGPLAWSGPFSIWDAEGPRAHWRQRATEAPFFGLVNIGVTHESALFPRPALPRSVVHLLMQPLYLYEFWGHRDVVTDADVVLPPYYPDTPVVRRDLARHYNHIHRLDERVGAMLAELEADGLADSTVVLFVSDHGDGLPRGKRELYDSGIRVPLVVRWPAGRWPRGLVPGDVDPRLVSLVDLAPTILALAGVEPPAGLDGRVFAGPAAAPPRRVVYAARDRTDEVPDRQRAVRDLRYKYIRNAFPGRPGAQPLAFRDQQDIMRELWSLHGAGQLSGPAARWFEPRSAEELYDTRADPHEVRNLAADPAQRVHLERLRAALDAWLARRPDLGALPEEELRERLWPDGRQPRTATPRVAFRSGTDGVLRAALSCRSEGASIGYRVNGRGRGAGWQLYVEPFDVAAGDRVEAKAVRYGWAESPVGAARAPDPGSRAERPR